MRGERVELVCEGCGKTFSRLKSNIAEGTKHHYCCRECKIEANKAQKVKRVCKQCGKHFEVYKSSLEKSNTSGNFCCRKCYDEYQKTLTGEKNRNYRRITVECPNCGKEIKTNTITITQTEKRTQTGEVVLHDIEAILNMLSETTFQRYNSVRCVVLRRT